MNLGIVIDSASGITKDEAAKKNWYFLPLHFFIDDKDYRDGIDLKKETFYKNISSYSNVKTSASYIGEAQEVIDKASQKHDHVIVFTISQHLSSQNANILAATKDKKNIHVIPSKTIGPTILKAVTRAEKMSKEDANIKDIIAMIHEYNDKNFGFLIPQTLDWLVKGGRISPAIASMAKLLKIVPIIIFKDGKLDRFGKGRIFEKVVLKTSQKAKKIIEKEKDDYEWYLMHSSSSKNNETIDKIEDALGFKTTRIFLPPVIGAHVGPGSICIFLTKK